MALQNYFLEQFTKELLLNSIDPYDVQRIKEKKRKTEKIKQELKKIMEQEKIEEPQKISLQIPYEQPKSQIQIPVQPEVQPEQQQIQEDPDANLGKIEQILYNRSIASIECPGPGKFIILKRGRQRFPVRVVLDNEDIEGILDFFSTKSRIPRIGGMFKAIVNNMIITAIESSRGKRFIITKTAPRPSRFL